VAQAIAGLLMLLPIHSQRYQLYLPLDILAATGLDRESFLAGEDEARISAAVEAFAGLGLEHLAKARQAGPIPRSVFPAFLPAALAEPVLKRARRMGARVITESLQPAQWQRQLRLLRASISCKL
jgi:phytoene synthase